VKLAVENIAKVFPSRRGPGAVVLGGISFSIGQGEFITLLGPSGCGKTTLLNIIAGFLPATSGSVVLNGRSVTSPGPDRGFIFQSYALFPWMRLRDNVLFPMKQLHVPREEQERRLRELLAVAQLEGKERLYPHQLSGGMKQRTAVIRALAARPEVLLMDEPFGAVDFQMRRTLQEQMEALWLKTRITVLMVTHDVDEAIYLSDRVLVMSADRGRLVEDLRIDLPRPRQRKGHEYHAYEDVLTDVLKDAAGATMDKPRQGLQHS
jgi:NitT/TauT family transport system ATP-binding protein